MTTCPGDSHHGRISAKSHSRASKRKAFEFILSKTSMSIVDIFRSSLKAERLSNIRSVTQVEKYVTDDFRRPALVVVGVWRLESLASHVTLCLLSPSSWRPASTGHRSRFMAGLFASGLLSLSSRYFRTPVALPSMLTFP